MAVAFAVVVTILLYSTAGSLLVPAMGGFLAFLIFKAIQDSNERLRRDKARQLALRSQIIETCEAAIDAFEAVPKDLLTAEQLLDVAGDEFRTGAFSPFWDSIERAMSKLGSVDASIANIASGSSRYKQLTSSYGGDPPPFPVQAESARRLVAANETSGRLSRLVREAQRNFQFATIYEQRRTNQILIAGFTSLGDAIHGLGTHLEQSIDALGDQIGDLSSSMTTMNEKVVASLEGVSSAVSGVGAGVTATIKGAEKNVQAAMSEQAARQERAVGMLDNIQRRRVPPPLADY